MSLSRIQIRRALSTDLPAADALEHATFTAHAISPRQMRYLQRNPRAIFLVAIKQRKLVGDAIALLRKNPSGKQTGRIYSVVVDPAHRGEKIGMKLMVALLAAMDRAKVDRVSLEVEHTNAGAIHLYEKLGFVIASRHRHYYGRGKHAERMVRGL